MLRELLTNFWFLPPIRQIYKWQRDGKWYDISIATGPCHKKDFAHTQVVTAYECFTGLDMHYTTRASTKIQRSFNYM